MRCISDDGVRVLILKPILLSQNYNTTRIYVPSFVNNIVVGLVRIIPDKCPYVCCTYDAFRVNGVGRMSLFSHWANAGCEMDGTLRRKERERATEQRQKKHHSCARVWICKWFTQPMHVEYKVFAFAYGDQRTCLHSRTTTMGSSPIPSGRQQHSDMHKFQTAVGITHERVRPSYAKHSDSSANFFVVLITNWIDWLPLA